MRAPTQPLQVPVQPSPDITQETLSGTITIEIDGSCSEQARKTADDTTTAYLQEQMGSSVTVLVDAVCAGTTATRRLLAGSVIDLRVTIMGPGQNKLESIALEMQGTSFTTGVRLHSW